MKWMSRQLCTCVQHENTMRYNRTMNKSSWEDNMKNIVLEVKPYECVHESTVIVLIFRVKWKCNSFARVIRLISKQFKYVEGSVAGCTQHQRHSSACSTKRKVVTNAKEIFQYKYFWYRRGLESRLEANTIFSESANNEINNSQKLFSSNSFSDSHFSEFSPKILVSSKFASKSE